MRGRSEAFDDRVGFGRCSLWSGRSQVAFPTYFPAVSSSGTNWRARELVQYLTTSRFPRMLVSAYDLCREPRVERGRLRTLVRRYIRDGGTLLLDSGTFEAYWRRDATWKPDTYQHALAEIQPQIASTWDSYLPGDRPGGSGLFGGTRIDFGIDSRVCPVGLLRAVHSTSPRSLPSIVQRVLSVDAKPFSIAFPERECGWGLLQRLETIARVRRALDAMSPSTQIHIFGSGNPIAMAFYVYAGASSFDSQDWSQSFIDPTSFLATDYSVAVFRKCACRACKRLGDGTYEASLAHNLVFLLDFTKQLHAMVQDRTLWDFLVACSSRKFVDRVVRSIRTASVVERSPT
jgi:hypothetical protein